MGKSSFSRREFIGTTAAALTALSVSGCTRLGVGGSGGPMGTGNSFMGVRRAKTPARIRGAFFYPTVETINAGKTDDRYGNSGKIWATYPGNQFQYEAQHAKFMDRINQIAGGLDVAVNMDAGNISTTVGAEAFQADIQANRPDALLLVNFYNTMTEKIIPIIEAYDGPVIMYQVTGSSHQLPNEALRQAANCYFIHSIENWNALERGLRAVHAMNRMRQSRLLRVGPGKQSRDAFLGTAIEVAAPEEYNDLFDSIVADAEIERVARSVRARARQVTEVEMNAFVDAVRAHVAVGRLMERYQADAITIRCLELEDRKPCLSFALNNGALVPCGCENDLDAILTLMLGAELFGRGGFINNPGYDNERNLYFGSHCTCTTRLKGPNGRDAGFSVRPFTHMLPKTVALDIEWPEDEPATLFKYQSAEKKLHAWTGDVLDSPATPPTGGCATRVLLRIRDVDDVMTTYPGRHPSLFSGDFARHAIAFSKLYGVEVATNARHDAAPPRSGRVPEA